MLIIFWVTLVSLWGAKVENSLSMDLPIKIAEFWGVFDNIQKTYANPLNAQWEKKLETHPQVSWIPHIQSVNILSLSNYQRRALFRSDLAQAALWISFIRHPKEIQLQAFLINREGNVVLRSSIQTLTPYLGLEEAYQASIDVANSLWAQLPYDGWVLQRNQQMILVNVGEPIAQGQFLLIQRVWAVETHPTQGFITRFRTFTVGLARVVEVKQNTALATIVEEWEKNPLSTHDLVTVVNYKKWPILVFEDRKFPNYQKRMFFQSPIDQEGMAPQNGLAGFGPLLGIWTQSLTKQNLSAQRYSDFGILWTANIHLWWTTNWTNYLQFNAFQGNPFSPAFVSSFKELNLALEHRWYFPKLQTANYLAMEVSMNLRDQSLFQSPQAEFQGLLGRMGFRWHIVPILPLSVQFGLISSLGQLNATKWQVYADWLLWHKGEYFYRPQRSWGWEMRWHNWRYRYVNPQGPNDPKIWESQQTFLGIHYNVYF